MKAILLTLLLILQISIARAGAGGGNGGDGVILNGKIYVLDLVESGVEAAPYFDRSIVINPGTRNRILRALSPEHYPLDLITRKIQEISRINPTLGEVLLTAMEKHSWRLVNSSLIDIKDEYTSLANLDLVQLAVRKNSTIMIDKSLWGKIDAANKVALVFHEILYALDSEGSTRKSSEAARELNGYLFTKYLSQGGNEELTRLGGSVYAPFLKFGDKTPILEKDGGKYHSTHLYVGLINELSFRKQLDPAWYSIQQICKEALDGKTLVEVTDRSSHIQINVGIESTTIIRGSIHPGVFGIHTGRTEYLVNDQKICEQELPTLIKTKDEQILKLLSEAI